MSKEAVIIQEFNEKERKYEYFVKNFDVTESVKILLKRHKEEYDKEKNIFAGTQGFIEAQQLYKKQIADLKAKLAEYEKFMKDNEWNSIEEMQKTLNKCEEKYFNLQVQLISMEARCQKCKHLNNKIELNIKNKLMAELAEKEKEIENLNKEWIKSIHDWKEIVKKKDQDKISFAVSELERAKIEFETYYADRLNEYPEYLEDRIMQLKEGK